MPDVLYGEILGPDETGPDDGKRSDSVRRKFWATFRKLPLHSLR